jgi:hypothetical protein
MPTGHGRIASMPRCAAGWSTAPPGRTTSLLLIEIVSAGPAGQRRHEQTMAELSSLFVDCGAWRPAGCAALEPHELAQALVGAMHRLVQARLLAGRPEELPSLATGLAALAAAGSR